ncbi:MAG: hypothetical protein ACK4GW_08360 [Pseudorhodobacter sp.]
MTPDSRRLYALTGRFKTGTTTEINRTFRLKWQAHLRVIGPDMS